MNYKQRWFSGRILACHAGGPGSIPGRCRLLSTHLNASWLTDDKLGFEIVDTVFINLIRRIFDNCIKMIHF